MGWFDDNGWNSGVADGEMSTQGGAYRPGENTGVVYRPELDPNAGGGEQPAPAPRQYTAQEADWLARNPGDEGRMAEALGSQRSGDPGGGGGGGSARLSSFAAPAPTPYQAFTEKFEAPTAPTDLMDKWDQKFVAPTAPADLMEKWDQKFSWSPEQAANDPANQARIAQAIKGRERYAAARGNLLTGGTTGQLDEDVVNLSAGFQDQDYGRALGTYNTNFNTFQGDKTRRSDEFGRTFDRALTGYQTDFNTFQGDKERRTAAFGQQFDQARGAYLDRAGIHNQNETGRYSSERSNRMDDFSMFDADRNFGLADRNMGLAERTADRNFGLAERGFGENVRMNNFGIDQSLWGRGNTEREQDRIHDQRGVDNLFRFTDYGFDAANNLTAAGADYARSGGNTMENIGNARGAGHVGSANAWQNGFNGAANGVTDAAMLWGYGRGV
jgi:hypothetical protein